MGRKRPRPFEGRTFGRLERVVTALVEAGLQDPATAPPNLIGRLRDLERNAAAAGDRQILQVIASGRRLLGDEQALTGPGVPTDSDMAETPLRDATSQADDPEASRDVPVSPVGTATAALLTQSSLHDLTA